MDALQLRDALAAHFDHVITPEVATAILRAACLQSDRSHDPAKFGQYEYRGVLFQSERLRDIVDEVATLHEVHFAETEKHRHHLGLAVDIDYLIAQERAGNLIQFTARDDGGRLVGQIRMAVHESIHTQTLYADEELLYLNEVARKGFTAIRFIQYVEGCMKLIGVREVRTLSKLATGSHRLMEYLGYTHLANQYIKSLQE